MAAKFKKKKTRSDGNFRKLRFEKTSPSAENKLRTRLEKTSLRPKAFGGDAFRGNTRSHPEHDGKDLNGRWYCTGDGVGE